MLSINEPLQLQAPGWHRAGESVRTGRPGEGVAAADRRQTGTLLPGAWAGKMSLLWWAPVSALLCNLHAGFFLQDSDSHSGRPVLYQMLAQHSYLAQGPGDLEFSKGDVLDILSEGSLSSPAAGPGSWSLLWGGTRENVASPVLSQVQTPRSYRLALGFAQS